jgi:hypothetical protein
MGTLNTLKSWADENRNLLILQIVLLQIATLICFIALKASNGPISFKVPTISTTEELKKNVCFFAFKNLANGEASKHLFDSEIADALNEQRSEAFPNKVKEIYSPNLINSEKCKIVASDSKGLRAFELDLKEAQSPFGYQIVGIQERTISEEDKEQ